MRTALISHLVVLVVGVVLGILVYRWWVTPDVQVVQGPSGPLALVGAPVLTAPAVVDYVDDKREVARLLNEQAAQKHEIETLTETVATLRAQGTGEIAYVDRPVPGEAQVVREAHFKDWRLTFDAVGAQATYTLAQQFEALTVVGKDSRGQPTATVRLFEIGPGEVRTALTDTKTTVVAAQPNTSRWRASFAVQAGVGLSATNRKAVAAVAGQWLKYGTSHAAEDNLWAALTPAFIAGEGVALLPVSVNIGRLPKQPFRDLWISPFVGTKASLGVVVTATF